MSTTVKSTVSVNKLQNNIANVINKIYLRVNTGEGRPMSTLEFERDSTGSIKTIWVKNRFKYVSDFELIWCARNEHYRVYIHIASPKANKVNPGYNISTIGNKKEASDFVAMYSYICATRSNNKERDVEVEDNS